MRGGSPLKTTLFAGGLLLAGTAMLALSAAMPQGGAAAQSHEAHDNSQAEGHEQSHGDHGDHHGGDHGDHKAHDGHDGDHGDHADHSGHSDHMADGDHAGHGDHAEHKAQGDHAGHGDHGNIQHGNIEDYPGQKRIVADYTAPAVTLRDQDNAQVDLAALLAEDKPAVVQFIFTTCTTLCPVLTATLSQAEDDIVAADSDVQIISITIDPERDTPRRLKEYSGMYGAGGNWTFLTGGQRDIMQVVRAFDAAFESNNKMYHQPYTYIRSGTDRPWLRIEAILSANELTGAYRQVQEAGRDVGDTAKAY